MCSVCLRNTNVKMAIAKCLKLILYLDRGFESKDPIELNCPKIALTSLIVLV
jgi:hypothetical protein